MPEFLKKLFREPGTSTHQTPKSKRAVTGKVSIPGNKGFNVVREDILQKGLTRSSSKQAA